jgi:hypothetical protein
MLLFNQGDTMNGIILIAGCCLLLLSLPAGGNAAQEGPGRGEPRRERLGGAGSLGLPDGFSHEQLQGIDTTVGRIQRQDPPMLISYDIGRSAGRYANPARRGDYAWMTQQAVGERRVHIAMRDRDGRRVLMVTVEPVAGVGEMDPQWPANFAAEIKNERDVAEALLIALSYEPAR